MSRSTMPSPDAAIARVLRAEADARAAVAAAQAQVGAMAEAARADARARSERTERRIRAVAAAFEVRTARELAAIEAEAAGLRQPEPPDEAARSAVAKAVARLAREMIQGPP